MEPPKGYDKVPATWSQPSQWWEKLVFVFLVGILLYLIFGFFFIMLVVSNLIIGYSTLFRNREAQWFLSLPLRHSCFC